MAEEKKKAPEKPAGKKPDDKGAEPPKKEKEEKAAGGAPAAVGAKIMFPAVIAAVIVINLVMAFVLIKTMAPKKEKEEDVAAHADSTATGEETPSAEGMAVTEKPIEAVVNIAGTDGKRYLKVAVALEYDPRKYKNLFLALEEHLEPKLKSVLIETVSTLTLEELNEPEIKEKICKEYVRRVNSSLSKKVGEFSEAMITTFLIQ